MTSAVSISISSEIAPEIREYPRASTTVANAYVRPIAWRGSEMMGVSAQNNRINCAIAIWQWPSYFDPAQKLKGIRLDLAEYRRTDPRTAPVRISPAEIPACNSDAGARGRDPGREGELEGEEGSVPRALTAYANPMESRSRAPIAACAFAGAVLLILLRVITADEAYSGLRPEVLMLIAGMVVLGIALDVTGLAGSATGSLIDSLDGMSPLLALVIIYGAG